MALFEVFIPGKETGMPNITLTVEAQNWIGALRSGLKSIGEGQEAIANVMCDIKEDNSIHVTDVATRRVFRLREVAKPADSKPAESKPAAAAPAGAPPSDVAPKTSEGPRPVSMEGATTSDTIADGDATLRNVRPEAFSETQPKTLIEFPLASVPVPTAASAPKVELPNPESSVAWTKMPGPASGPSPASAPAPVTAATTPMPVAPSAPPAPAQGSGDANVTERIERPAKPTATTKPTTLPPVGPPTPRGVPAPMPKRPSGQFAQAPEPKSREVSAANPKTDPRIGRAPTTSQAATTSSDVQDAIAAVFDATQDLYMETQLRPQQVADKLLDIALAHIPAESGTFYIADVNSDELQFTSVRGPKADALKKSGMTVKVGQGIVGFCAQEGVCLAVSDIQKDPRFYSAIAKTIGYQPKDTICASAEKEGRLWGAVQLINSKNGFEAAHMEVLRFIGLTAAAMLERIDASSGRDA